MISNALALSILTTVGCYVVYSKLPKRVKKFIEKHSLMTDLVTLIAIYYLLGGTLVALFAGAMCGIFVSIMLHIANNEQDFLYLYDLRDFLKARLVEVKDVLTEFGKNYREVKTEKAK